MPKSMPRIFDTIENAPLPALDNQTALREKRRVAEEFRQQLANGSPSNDDEAKISAYLSTAAHPYVAKRVSTLDREPNPESAMMNHFKSTLGRRYEDRTHAIKVLKAADTDFKKLRRSPTFARFEQKLLAAL